jgi:peroxiredoxin
MRLKAGIQAPKFTGITQQGNPISLDDYQGKVVNLKFFRYASCPVGNYLVDEYNALGRDLDDAGVTTLIVLHASKESCNNKLKAKNKYTIIADPEKHIFDLYQIEKSWWGIIAPNLYPSYIKAIGKGFFSPKLLGNEGGDTGMPADFLIDGAGTIRYAHYGRHASDSTSASDSLELVRELGLAGPSS